MVSFDIIIAKTLYFCYSFVTRVPKCTLTQTILKHCTGTGQAFTIPAAGTYCFECWGASGGNDPRTVGSASASYTTTTRPYVDQWDNSNKWNKAGKGGYTKGNISLNKDELIFVYVGGAGNNSYGNAASGGYNGGGAGSQSGSGNTCAGGGGGGSTDFRIKGTQTSSNPPIWNDSKSLNNRIMVAGGGGGVPCYSNGGCGGGVYGGVDSTFDPTTYPSMGASTQSTGGTMKSGTNYIYTCALGLFGYAYLSTSDQGNSGGGGGGYWGGARGYGNGGNGGSSYISGHAGCEARASETATSNKTGTANTIAKSTHWSGKLFTASSIVMIDGAGYQWTTAKGSKMNVPKTDFYETTNKETTTFGHSGDGFARITQISVD